MTSFLLTDTKLTEKDLDSYFLEIEQFLKNTDLNEQMQNSSKIAFFLFNIVSKSH